MRLWVGITDSEWFRFCSERSPDEVNFWQPSGEVNFRVLEPGGLFLFKLHSPDDFIVGGGFFVRFTALPARLAWEAFGEKNGVVSLVELVERVRKYRKVPVGPNPTIGCNILTDPFYLPREEWIPVPKSWGKSIVRGKSYDSTEQDGLQLLEQVQARLQGRPGFHGTTRVLDTDSVPRYGTGYLARARLGQGAFRVLVTDLYNRRCAMTGERTLPALEAAHIQPYSKEGPHTITNGLLLRSDLHRLFDEGYITVTSDLKIEVSRKIKEEFENGREYYSLHGAGLKVLPEQSEYRPGEDRLDWHRDNIYLG